MEMERLLMYATGFQLDEEAILNALGRWEVDVLPTMWGRVLFYCYDCGFPKCVSEKMLMRSQRPRCPICRDRMAIYDVGVGRNWPTELGRC
jgi:hypothetical protein